jgi:hypothetical protein
MSGPRPLQDQRARFEGPALMPNRIEGYALIGDCKTAVLVSTGCAGHGSTRRFVLHRSWATATMAAGRSATDATRWCRNRVHRRRWQRGGPGRFVSVRQGQAESRLVRVVVGERATVVMHAELIVRFGYRGWTPWVTRGENGDLLAVIGPDMRHLRTPGRTARRAMTTVSTSSFSQAAGPVRPKWKYLSALTIVNIG